MALSHAHPAQAVDVRPYGADLPQQRTAALFKSADLEVIRLVLQAGQSLPAHQVAGEITLHCLEGAVEVGLAGGQRQLLNAGQLLFLARGARHDLVATAPASLLLTLALSPSGTRSA